MLRWLAIILFYIGLLVVGGPYVATGVLIIVIAINLYGISRGY